MHGPATDGILLVKRPFSARKASANASISPFAEISAGCKLRFGKLASYFAPAIHSILPKVANRRGGWRGGALHRLDLAPDRIARMKSATHIELILIGGSSQPAFETRGRV
jgi:hypothetical protein